MRIVHSAILLAYLGALILGGCSQGDGWVKLVCTTDSDSEHPGDVLRMEFNEKLNALKDYNGVVWHQVVFGEQIMWAGEPLSTHRIERDTGHFVFLIAGPVQTNGNAHVTLAKGTCVVSKAKF